MAWLPLSGPQPWRAEAPEEGAAPEPWLTSLCEKSSPPPELILPGISCADSPHGEGSGRLLLLRQGGEQGGLPERVYVMAIHHDAVHQEWLAALRQGMDHPQIISACRSQFLRRHPTTKRGSTTWHNKRRNTMFDLGVRRVSEEACRAATGRLRGTLPPVRFAAGEALARVGVGNGVASPQVLVGVVALRDCRRMRTGRRRVSRVVRG